METTSSGRHQLVSIKHSRSHHHHHHRRHDHDTCLVGRDEWKRLAERDRCLGDANKSLAASTAGLKASLATAEAKAHHLGHVVVPQLQGQVKVLCADNEALRRSLDKAAAVHGPWRPCGDCERHRQAADALNRDKRRLEAQAAKLAAELEQQGDAGYWRDEVRCWKARYEDSQRRHDDTCGMLVLRTDKMRAYEELLRRRGLL